MKFIPSAISRKIATQGLLASEHSPKILFGVGLTAMIGSSIMTGVATLKLEGILDEIEGDKEQAHQVKGVVDGEGYSGEATYTDAELRKDLAIITTRGIGRVVRVYAPSVILGGIGIVCLTKSHRILEDRNLALAAAYSAVDGAYRRYRERVVDRYGEETDRELLYESEKVDFVDDETGKIISRDVAIGAPGSAYSRFYDEHSSRNWSVDPDINVLFLRCAQNTMNDRLRARGHLFLNEVYSELGMSHTKAGAVVGWRWNKDSGDDYVDFGIWDGQSEVVNEFFNGREGAILLDFNVDGVIYDKLEEVY